MATSRPGVLRQIFFLLSERLHMQREYGIDFLKAIEPEH